MDGNADASAAFLVALSPDRVVPSRCHDLVSRDETQSFLAARSKDHRPASGPWGRGRI